jgi:hypothetical protein
MTVTRHCKVLSHSRNPLFLKVKALKGNSFYKPFFVLHLMYDFWELAFSRGILGSACRGTFLTHVSLSPASSLCSGVWRASVSQWGRNQKASLEAGAAGHLGPTVPEPVELELRVQRGSATTLSKPGHGYFLPFIPQC